MQDLARRIEQTPYTALAQTIPMPVRQNTFFGRFVQFAAHLYSPMLATGLSFWQTDSATIGGTMPLFVLHHLCSIAGYLPLKDARLL